MFSCLLRGSFFCVFFRWYVYNKTEKYWISKRSMTEYSFKIKTKNKRECAKVMFGNTEYLMAKFGTEYCLELHNGTDQLCQATVHTCNKHIGVWWIEARSRVIITASKQYKEKLTFTNVAGFHHINDGPHHEDVQSESKITVAFLPLGSSVTRCAPATDASQNMVCYQDINWDRVTILSTPVLLCDNHL